MKRLIPLLLCLLVLIPLPCAAQEQMILLNPVTDQADLLSRDEEVLLIGQAIQIFEEYGIFVAILTVDHLDGKTSMAYADDYYDQHYYPEYPDGVLLLIAMDSRDWYISTCGTAIDRLTDYELDQVFFGMADDLRDNRFYDAFTVYLDLIPQYMQIAPQSEPGFGDFMRILLISLLIGAAAGGITILVMRSQMNTAKPQYSAGNYLVNGSFQLKKHFDIFLYSRVTRTAIPKNNGSSTHRSSGGISHGGRGGKF